MRRIILTFIVLFLLSGCVYKSDSIDIYKAISDTENKEINKEYKVRENNNSLYFDYYLPSDCQEKDFEFTTLTIKYNDSIILYNLNIAGIINETYYSDEKMNDDGFFNEEYLFYSSQNTFINSYGEEDVYTLNVYKVENEYVVCLKSTDSLIYCYASQGDIAEVIRHIIIFMKTVEVDRESVLSAFYNKNTIDYHKKQINLFEYAIPANGYVSDLLSENRGDPEFQEENDNMIDADEIEEEYEEYIEE